MLDKIQIYMVHFCSELNHTRLTPPLMKYGATIPISGMADLTDDADHILFSENVEDLPFFHQKGASLRNQWSLLANSIDQDLCDEDTEHSEKAPDGAIKSRQNYGKVTFSTNFDLF